MKKSPIFHLLVLVGIWGAFLLPTAFASSLYIEEYPDTTIFVTNQFRSGLNVQQIAATTTPVSGIVNDASFKIQYRSGTKTANFYIELYQGGADPSAATLINTSNTVKSSTFSTTTATWITFSFNSPSLILAGTTYWWVLRSDSLDNPVVGIGSSNATAEQWRYCPGCGGSNWQSPTGGRYSFQLNGGSFGFATSTALTLTSPTSTDNLPYGALSTTTFNSDVRLQCGVGDIFSNGGFGACIASVFYYLWVPPTSSFSEYTTIVDQLQTKIPFSYVWGLKDAFFNIALNATSSMPFIDIPLSTYASSTVTGVIPDIVISTTTISTYLPDYIRLLLRTLITAGIWMSVGWLFFGEAMRVFKA